MLQLDFNTFIERYKIQTEANKRATLHYEEDSEKFTLYFKNFEFWEYYTEITKKTIHEFGVMYEVSQEEAIQDFKINYLSHAVELSNKNINPLTSEPSPQLGDPSEEISKSTDPEVVYEAKDYGDFFVEVVDKWKQRTLNAIDKVEIEKDYTSFEKTFGEFLQGLMNGINTIPFARALRKYIKSSMVEGMSVAEEEININVGWTEGFEKRLKSLEYQQLEGYMINGHKWYGIKGVSKQLQLDILKTVEEDVRNKKSRDEIKEHITEIFDGATTSQAERIARTETDRFVNEGKLSTYKQSGIKGRKAWSVVPSKCCDICQRMHDKYFDEGIPFDDDFVDDYTDKRFHYPPSHPNCRCVIEYRTQ